MLHDALGGGAFIWSRIQRLYEADPAVHWQRCESEGLDARSRCSPSSFMRTLMMRTLPSLCAPSTGDECGGNSRNSPVSLYGMSG